MNEIEAAGARIREYSQALQAAEKLRQPAHEGIRILFASGERKTDIHQKYGLSRPTIDAAIRGEARKTA